MSEIINQKIALKDLITDSYQRELDLRRVGRIVSDFDPAQVRDIVVSRRADGKLYVIDGQHTVEALKRIYGEDYKADARVIVGMDFKTEASLFTKLNRNSSRVKFVDTLKADYYSGAEYACKYIDALKAADIPFLFYHPNTKKGRLAVSSHFGMLEVVKFYGLETTVEALKLVKACTKISEARGEALYDPHIAAGLAAFITKYPDVNSEAIVEIAAEYGWKTVILKAASYNNGYKPTGHVTLTTSVAVAKAFAYYYNKVANKRIRLTIFDSII